MGSWGSTRQEVAHRLSGKEGMSYLSSAGAVQASDGVTLGTVQILWQIH